MKKTPVLTLYAHKGGVSKTTNVQHLSWTLVKNFSKKILLIDADPQCNLTQTLIPESRKNPEWMVPLGITTVYEALQPIFHGITKKLPEANCLEVRPSHFEGKGKLYLLPGSLSLASFEPILALAHSLSISPAYPIFNSIAGSFRALFDDLGKRYGVDLIIVDMGPSIGELNRNLFYSADFFIIPTAADVYCKSTIVTMQDTLDKWHRSFAPIAEATKEHGLPMKQTLPKFVGFIISMFNVIGKDKKPVKSSQSWMELIKATVEHCLVPSLQENGMIHGMQIEGFCVAEINNFLSLLPISQRAGFPVFDIPGDKFEALDEKTGEFKRMSTSEIKGHKERAEHFKKIYDDFALKVLSLLETN